MKATQTKAPIQTIHCPGPSTSPADFGTLLERNARGAAYQYSPQPALAPPRQARSNPPRARLPVMPARPEGQSADRSSSPPPPHPCQAGSSPFPQRCPNRGNSQSTCHPRNQFRTRRRWISSRGCPLNRYRRGGRSQPRYPKPRHVNPVALPSSLRQTLDNLHLGSWRNPDPHLSTSCCPKPALRLQSRLPPIDIRPADTGTNKAPGGMKPDRACCPPNAFARRTASAHRGFPFYLPYVHRRHLQFRFPPWIQPPVGNAGSNSCSLHPRSRRSRLRVAVEGGVADRRPCTAESAG